MNDEGPADRVMRAIRATHPWPPNPSLAGEIADCDTRAAGDSPDAAAYARRAAELRELAGQSGAEGLWQVLVQLEDPDVAADVHARARRACLPAAADLDVWLDTPDHAPGLQAAVDRPRRFARDESSPAPLP